MRRNKSTIRRRSKHKAIRRDKLKDTLNTQTEKKPRLKRKRKNKSSAKGAKNTAKGAKNTANGAKNTAKGAKNTAKGGMRKKATVLFACRGKKACGRTTPIVGTCI